MTNPFRVDSLLFMQRFKPVARDGHAALGIRNGGLSDF